MASFYSCYCSFIDLITTSFSSHLQELENVELYKTNNLIFSIINHEISPVLSHVITEFASPVQASEVMVGRIREYGGVVC